MTRLLTVAEYAALGETAWGYTELIAGRVLMSPSPSLDHAIALNDLFIQLHDRVPSQYLAITNLDFDLGLAPASEPGFSRRPDLMVVNHDVGKRIDAEGGLVRASEVLLVVEMVSPDTQRIDHVDKRRDYADAGIQYYWLLNLDDPVSITACHLTEEFGYVDDQNATGTFRAEVPFSVEINLERLR